MTQERVQFTSRGLNVCTGMRDAYFVSSRTVLRLVKENLKSLPQGVQSVSLTLSELKNFNQGTTRTDTRNNPHPPLSSILSNTQSLY